MVTPSRRRVARQAAMALLAVPVALLSACSPNEPEATSTGTVPPVWTGSAAPTESHQEGGPVVPDTLTAHLAAPDGVQVATAQFEFDEGFVKVTVTTSSPGQLTPGFHGLHVHQVAKCEPNSVAASGGAPGNFLSAGGHLQVGGHTSQPASGDLTSLQVREDGSALLVTTTDTFSKDDLLKGAGTAIIIHGGPDNFSNIPPERYTQVDGAPGPDETTLATGDAGKRAACGVIGAG